MKLSIITINYNNLCGLKKTADSIFAQTYRDFEWIIIDGGSNDGSNEFIESIAPKTEANISFWCSEKDNGIYNARNNAHMFYLVCRNLEERSGLINNLKEHDVLAPFHYLSLHKSDYYKAHNDNIPELPISDMYTDINSHRLRI